MCRVFSPARAVLSIVLYEKCTNDDVAPLKLRQCYYSVSLGVYNRVMDEQQDLLEIVANVTDTLLNGMNC